MIMEKVLHIYEDNNGLPIPFPNVDLQAELYSFQYDCKRMGTAPTITATVMYPICLDKYWNDNVYVDFKGERYYIDLTPSSSYSNTDVRYKHEMTFVSERKVLENIYFTDGILTEFHFFGDIQMVEQRLNDFFTKERLLYRVSIDSGITTEEKDVDVSKMYVNDFLLHVFDIFNIPYYFVGTDIHFGYNETEITETLKYGVEDALLSVNRQNTNTKIITKITGVGSRDNIPYYYPNFNESGEHDVTTTPSGYQNQISKLNYLKIDPYTNLRNGGWAKYHKACVNPIGDDSDNVSIEVLSISASSPIQTLSYDWKQNITAPDVDGTIYAEKEVLIDIKTIQPIKNNISISNILVARPDYGTTDYEQTFDVLSIKGRYTPNTDFFPKEEDVDYTITGTEILLNPSRLYDLGIVISLKSNVKFPVNQAGTVTAYFKYDTKYHSDKRNIEVNGEKSYSIYDKTISYADGIRTYRETFTYKVTREVAGYSTVYSDTIFRGMFLDADGKGLTEWYKFMPSSVEIKDSDGNDVTEQWWDSVNEYIHFRNTSDQRKVYTITMTVSVNMTTPEITTAYGVQLYYNPNFGRYEFPYDYWKFHDGGTRQKYSVFGVKFTNTLLIPDSLSVNFSATTNWIDPKPYLMPSVYRNTKGLNIWYNAVNDRYKDEKGNFISFVNLYNPNKPKAHISDPKEDIKPSIVGVTNANGERIDMFSDVAFDTNDNNDWITDDDGENQTLEHSFFFVKLRKMDFNVFDQALESGEMTITMTSGLCGSCDFTIMVNEDGENTVQVDSNGDLIRDADGNIKFGTPLDIQQDTTQSEVWIALRKEEDSYGVIMPDNDKGLVPTAGTDTFVFTNILLPNSYITSAEQKLEYELLKDLKENNVDKFEFSIDFSRIYLAENPAIYKNLNENCLIPVKYNGITTKLNVSSYSYTVSDNEALPQIRVELKENLSVVKNAIQKSEGKIIQYIKEVVVNNQQEKESSRSKGDGTSSQTELKVVQTTGESTKDVMSQKAVTKALKDLSNEKVEVTQHLGQSTSKVMSQKAVTDTINSIDNELFEVKMDIYDIQDEISDIESSIPTDVLEFNGFVNNVTIQNSSTIADGGEVYFDTARNVFVYKVNDLYYINWKDALQYMESDLSQPLTSVFFKHEYLYVWNNNELVEVGSCQIPKFYDIVERATLTPQTSFQKNGKVVLLESYSLDYQIFTKPVFAYKVGAVYYQSWSRVYDYMKSDLSEPISNRLFEFDNQQYTYNDGELSLIGESYIYWESL